MKSFKKALKLSAEIAELESMEEQVLFDSALKKRSEYEEKNNDEYPFDQCKADMMDAGNSNEEASKICRAIKASLT